MMRMRHISYGVGFGAILLACGTGCGGGGSATTAGLPGDGGANPDGSTHSGGDDAAPGDGSMPTSDGGGTDGSASQYAVGGTVTGLAGTGLVLQDNAGDNLTVSASGAFVFPTPLADGAAYSVTVLTQPGAPSQTCTVSDGSGNVSGADVSKVSVSCTTSSYTIGGTVAGISGTIVLTDNGGDALSLSANGPFSFATPIASGATYTVAVKTQPSGQTCTVGGPTGTVGSGDITGVVVNCAAGAHTVGGTISGLTGTVVLENNGGDSLVLNANGTFAFSTPLASGAPYDVKVDSQPPGEICTVTNGSGNVGGADVTGISVSCTANLYTIGGTVTGLPTGGSVTLQDNRGNDLTQGSNGTFVFSAPLASGSSYHVTISSQPAGQMCAVSGGDGTVGSGNVTSVVVDCAANSYTIGGQIQGLVSSVVLQDNGGNNLTLNGDGTFAFSQPLAFGAAYDVKVLTQPADETCKVTNGSGTVAAFNVNNVQVTCSGALHSVGGSLSGLGQNASVTLQDNGGNNLTLTANGDFVFSQKVAYGSPYKVAVLTQPLGEFCVVTNGFGTVVDDVSDVVVTCTAKHYTVGGNLVGLTANKSITLENNGGDDLVLTSNGQFAFPTSLPNGAMYAVTVKTPPAGETCTVTNDNGTVNLANVVDVIVSCH